MTRKTAAKLAEILHAIEQQRISTTEIMYLQDHWREVIESGNIELAQWAGIEESDYMRTHEHAN